MIANSHVMRHCSGCTRCVLCIFEITFPCNSNWRIYSWMTSRRNPSRLFLPLPYSFRTTVWCVDNPPMESHDFRKVALISRLSNSCYHVHRVAVFCSVADHRWCSNVVHDNGSVSLIFLPHYDMYCDQVLNKCTVTLNLHTSALSSPSADCSINGNPWFWLLLSMLSKIRPCFLLGIVNSATPLWRFVHRTLRDVF